MSQPATHARGHHVARVISNASVAEGHALLRFECDAMAGATRPGQFLHMRVSGIGQDPLLRRPICIADADGATFEILVRRAGRGTDLLALTPSGEPVDFLGPLGKGFTLPDPGERVALVGGSVGVAPLHYLDSTIADPGRTEVFIGARTSALLPRLARFEGRRVHLATDDGTRGFCGHIVQCLEEWLHTARVDRIYGCGPHPMLRALARVTREKGLWCEVSLEERMACGFGVCMGCSVPMVAGGYKRACMDGPVFNTTEVAWE